MFAHSRPGEPLLDTILDDDAGGRDALDYREDGSIVPAASMTGARPMPDAQRWHPRAVARAGHVPGDMLEALRHPRPQEGAAVAGAGLAVSSVGAARSLARSIPVHELGLRSAYETVPGISKLNGGNSSARDTRASPVDVNTGTDANNLITPTSAVDETMSSSTSRSGLDLSSGQSPEQAVRPVPSIIPPSLPGHWTLWAPEDTLGRDASDTAQLPLGKLGYSALAEKRETRWGVPGSDDLAFEVDYLMYAAAAALPVSVVQAPVRQSHSIR